jgi:diguanylate cyclase (GGDEF)-like protein
MEIRRQSILIVDDSVSNIEVLSGVMGIDYEVLFATSGEEALEVASQQSPDLILLDVVMPGMDGYETCKQIKKDDRIQDIPIIFVTAMNQEEDESRGLDVGGIDYITKPIRPSIVKARVRNHLELKRYRDLLKVSSTTDGLTGIANRRRLDQVLEIEWMRARLVQTPLSFIILDVDYFKEYNDNYGHPAGDICLKRLVNGLTEAYRRPGDLLARYGGDEFALLLPDTDAAGALLVAQRIEAKVSEINIGHKYATGTDRVTLSIGVATLIPIEKTTAQELLQLADEALYAAKQGGRNRIVTSNVTK